jgi:hypothetical protein
MEPEVGVFEYRSDAARGLANLARMGVTEDKINVLTPASTDSQIAATRVSDTEQPGMGEAMGTVVGGALGVAGGFSAGAALASLMVPGVGPILASGLLGAGILGLTGATAGAATGLAVEDSVSGLPRDELFVYEDALRRGRTVVMVEPEDEAHAAAVREALAAAGAETIDAAREQWWIGLRSAEQESYTYTDGEFAEVEPYYRKGFEAAQMPDARGKSFAQAQDYLTRRYQIASSNPAFRRGFERGRRYYESLRK